MTAFERADALLTQLVSEPASLCPTRTRSTPLSILASRLPPQAPVRVALGDALLSITEAWTAHFPGNLFWDFDLLVASLEASAADEIHGRARQIVRLAAGFGQDTPIRFQYLHDFLYGFDWVRWVQKAPDERHGVGPFDPPFLTYLEQRQTELIALIGQDDAKYPTLRSTGHRNPFPFLRTPTAEARLLHTLADRDAIPVAAWDPQARPDWRPPYTQWREAVARELGLVCLPAERSPS